MASCRFSLRKPLSTPPILFENEKEVGDLLWFWYPLLAAIICERLLISCWSFFFFFLWKTATWHIVFHLTSHHNSLHSAVPAGLQRRHRGPKTQRFTAEAPRPERQSRPFFFFFVPPKRSWGKRCVEDGVKEERVVYQRGRFPWLWCIIVPLLDVTRGKGQTWCLCGDFQPGPACTMASAVFLFFFFSVAGALTSVITRVIIISFFSRISPMADSLQELFYDQARQLSRSTHHLRCNVMCRCRPALFILEASVGGDIHVSAFFSSAVTSTGPCFC